MIRARRYHKLATIACAPCLVALAPLLGIEPESTARIELVEVDRLIAAMRAETGYDITKTTQAVIGPASVKRVRMVVGSGGVTVVRANVKKLLFNVSATVIVQPDGRATRDVPQDRQDLLALERRLKKHLDLDCEPTDWEDLVAAAYAQLSARVRTP